jgi:hypothetical protein
LARHRIFRRCSAERLQATIDVTEEAHFAKSQPSRRTSMSTDTADAQARLDAYYGPFTSENGPPTERLYGGVGRRP